MKKREQRNTNTRRVLPFTLTWRFFAIFAGISAVSVPVYFLITSSWWLIAAADLLLLVAAAADFAAAPRTDRFRFERPLPYPLAVDRPNDIVIEVTNRVGRPWTVSVLDDFPPHCTARGLPIRRLVSPGAGTILKYTLTPNERGDGVFGHIYYWIEGPLGLVRKRGEAHCPDTVKLYPALSLIEDRRMRLHREDARDAMRVHWKKGMGTEFDSLREYVVGDDSRLIHWGTSARRGKPIVRQNRTERSQTIFFVIDAGRMMTARVHGRTKMDYSLNAALLTSYSALAMGDLVGIMIVGRDVRTFVPPSKSPGQFGNLLDATYAIEPRPEEPRFHLALSFIGSRLRRRSLVIVLTDLIDERASQGLLRYTLGIYPRHLPVVAAMADTEVISVADSTPRNKEELYKQGVAAGILERRERLLARMSSYGVMILDTPPEDFSTDVLERYLEIKTRNLL